MSRLELPPCTSAADVWSRAKRVHDLRRAGLRPRQTGPAIKPPAAPASPPEPVEAVPVSHAIRLSASSPTIRKIVTAAADYFHVTPADILSDRRDNMATRPRQITMYLARKYTNWSFPRLGEVLGRDHATVHCGFCCVTGWLASNDIAVTEAVTTIEAWLAAGEWEPPPHAAIRRGHWSAEDLMKLEQGYLARRPPWDIARALRRSPDAVRNKAAEAGIKYPEAT
jgi:hypothetical protein